MGEGTERGKHEGEVGGCWMFVLCKDCRYACEYGECQNVGSQSCIVCLCLLVCVFSHGSGVWFQRLLIFVGRSNGLRRGPWQYRV